MVNKLRILIFLVLTIEVVLISGCVQEKALTTEPIEAALQSSTIAPTSQPSATGIATITSVTARPSRFLIEDTDFEFSDKCEIQTHPGASGGSFLACPKVGLPPAPGEKINITFTGTAVSVIHFGLPNGGTVKVQIDGKDYPEINMSGTEGMSPCVPESVVRTKKQIASNLQNTKHVLTFEITNKSTTPSRNPNEAGDIYIDAIEVTVPQ